MKLRIALLAALAIAATGARAQDVKLITTAELKAKLAGGSKGLLLVDSRTEVEFGEGHIPGAVLIPAKQTVAKLPEKGARKDSLLVFYCNGPECTKSRKAYKAAAAAGYANLLEYNEGLPAWRAAGHAVEGTPLPAVDVPGVDAKEARALLSSAGAPALLDVRDADEFQSFRIAGARSFPVDAIQKRAAELPAGPILIVDHVGHQAKIAARALAKVGRKDLRFLKGGMMAWSDAGFPVEEAP
jgi:rhodanese-related sulfurtransferase